MALFRFVILNCRVPSLDRDILTVIGEHITAVRCGIIGRAEEAPHFHVLDRMTHVNDEESLI